MASNVNIVVLMGNLTRDPELKYTGQGTAVCDLSMAINYTRGKGDQKTEEVSYIDVTAFGKNAENAGEYLKKGRQVVIEGRLQQERWEDKTTGQKRSKVKVIAERVTFVGKGQDSAATEAAPPAGEEVPF
jgi:single-strand DNA-binding protein